MRRPGDDEREKRERNTSRSFTLPEEFRSTFGIILIIILAIFCLI